MATLVLYHNGNRWNNIRNILRRNILLNAIWWSYISMPFWLGKTYKGSEIKE